MGGTKQMIGHIGCEHAMDLDTIKYHKSGRVGRCKKCGIKLYLVLSKQIPEPRTRPKGSKKARRRARQKILEKGSSPPSLLL